MTNEIPTINMDKCNGCDICVDECPTNVFEMEADHKAHVIEPAACIDCMLCETDCPTNAIHMVAA